MTAASRAITGLLVAALVAGCGVEDDSSNPGAPTAGTGPTVELVSRGGCGDAVFTATNEADDLGVTVHVDVKDRTDRVEIPVDVKPRLRAEPSMEVEVTIIRGSQLSTLVCRDVIPSGAETTSSSPAATAVGTVTVDAPGTAEHGFANGTVELRELTAADGTEFAPIVIETDMIGFYAG